MELIISDEAKKEIHEMCVRRAIDKKFEPQTREELEAEFEELIKQFKRIAIKYKKEELSTIEIETNYYLDELKELFYNILKRIN